MRFMYLHYYLIYRYTFLFIFFFLENNSFFSGSDGCEDGISGRFETVQQESHRQPLQQEHEPFHIRQQSPAVVKQDPINMSSFLQQQPFGIFGQSELFRYNIIRKE